MFSTLTMERNLIMKNVFLTVIVALCCTTGVFSQTKWTIDNIHSNVQFSVPHLVISEVEGNFSVYSGTIETPRTDFSDAKVAFSIDVNSISTGNEMRDKHLKSDDFFNAQKYPTMTFSSVSWKNIGENIYTLEGDLTIRDVTKRVTFDVTYGGTIKDGYGNTKAGFKATTIINRFEYGLKWNALTEAGGITVGKDVTITLRLEFAQQKSS